MTRRSEETTHAHGAERRAAIARIEAVMRDRQHERERAFATELEAWKTKREGPTSDEPRPDSADPST